MTTFVTKVVKTIGYIIATLIIVAALMVSLARLLTPVLNKHHADIEQWVSKTFDREVTIAYIHLSWNVYEPELAFESVTVYDPKTHQPSTVIPRVELMLNWWGSLLHWQPRMSSIKVSGVHFTLREQKSGIVNVEGFSNFALSDDVTGHSLNPNLVFSWIFSQSYLEIQDMDILFINKNGQSKSITLNHLSLQNTRTTHNLIGDGTLNQDVPTSLNLAVRWTGKVTDIAHIKANWYVYLRGVSLTQWLSGQKWDNFSIKDGIGSAKIWASWDKNTWQSVQTTFQFYNLAAISLVTKKPLMIDRLSGNVGWKRNGTNEVIAGNDILMDLPDHLWPTNNFKVEFSRAADNTPIIKTAAMGYLDIADTTDFLQNMGLMPKEFQADLVALNPRGEIRNAQVAFNGALTDPNSISAASGEFSGMTINAWQAIPSVTNLSGAVVWNGKQGKLQLNSQQLAIDFNHVFDSPLQFDSVNGKVTWQKDVNNNWSWMIHDLQIVNADAKAHVDMGLVLPANASPSVDLKGDFTLLNAANISRYLPLKTYHPALVKWLQAAFLNGQAVDGKAILQGQLSDFPFDQGKGIFNISANVKDVGFLYAPGWPVLQHINGKLVFAGRGMSVDVTSAQLQSIPIGMVHAEIPAFNDQKTGTVLTVQTIVQSDLAQGLQFIHSSPLENTLGKDLSELQLQGPMQLKLGLIVPLGQPEKLTVSGDTTITNARLIFPNWKLSIDNMQGMFHFSEQGIDANNLQGTIFNSPITLTLATKQQHVIADLVGDLSIPALQTWLAVPLDKVVTGTAHYQAELHLAAHGSSQPTIVTIRSDLKGITIDLPSIYGKKAEDATDFEGDIFAGVNQPLRLKLRYAKLLSAAMNFEKTAQGIHLAGANLRLGTGEPSWPTQTGIELTGTIDELNWDKIKANLAQDKNTASTSPEKFSFDPNLLRSVDILANKVQALGLQLTQLRIQVTRLPDYLQIKLTNAMMDGQIMLPTKSNQRTIQAKFQRLYIPTQSGGKESSTLNPREIPPLSFTGNDVRYGDKSLGHVSLNTIPGNGGLIVQQLMLELTSATVTATGDWRMINNRNVSHVKGDLTSQNVSKTLSALGFSSANLVGSSGNVQFDLTWQGTIYDPSVNGMSGNVALKLGEGRIINLGDSTDAKMGIGKLLNIFSLQTIPRRLSLDFSDVFEKGYSFDSLQGNFTLKNGNAVTKDTRFDGTIARVDITGRIGMAAKDFDMKMSVTPYVNVTSSLPLVATIAGAAPVIGLATLVLGSVVSHAVSKVTTYDYSVTGTWANPKWQQISTRQVSNSH